MGVRGYGFQDFTDLSLKICFFTDLSEKSLNFAPKGEGRKESGNMGAPKHQKNNKLQQKSFQTCCFHALLLSSILLYAWCFIHHFVSSIRLPNDFYALLSLLWIFFGGGFKCIGSRFTDRITCHFVNSRL